MAKGEDVRTVLHLVVVGELIRLSRASYWGRSMNTISSGPTRDPTYSDPPINHWPLPSELWFLGVPSGLFPSSGLSSFGFCVNITDSRVLRSIAGT